MYIKTLKNILQTNGRISKSNHIIKPINYKHKTKTRMANPHIKEYNLVLTTPARKDNYKDSRISIENYPTHVVKYKHINTRIY